MDLKIDDNQLAQVMSKTIFDSLPQTERERMLQAAVATLILPAPDRYSGRVGISPLQEAFNSAVTREAQKRVAEWLDDPRHTGEIKRMVNEAMDKVVGEHRHAVITAIVNAFTKALKAP